MKPPFYGIPTPVPEIDFLYDGDQELRGMWGQPPSAVRSSEARQLSSAEFLKGSYVGRLSPSAVFCEAFGGLSVVMA
jgi:hypothetical protein